MGSDKEAADVESGRGPSKISHMRSVFDQAGITPEIENWKYAGAGTEDDPYVSAACRTYFHKS